jgi:hypothetical protein
LDTQALSFVQMMLAELSVGGIPLNIWQTQACQVRAYPGHGNEIVMEFKHLGKGFKQCSISRDVR